MPNILSSLSSGVSRLFGRPSPLTAQGPPSPTVPFSQALDGSAQPGLQVGSQPGLQAGLQSISEVHEAAKSTAGELTEVAKQAKEALPAQPDEADGAGPSGAQAPAGTNAMYKAVRSTLEKKAQESRQIVLNEAEAGRLMECKTHNEMLNFMKSYKPPIQTLVLYSIAEDGQVTPLTISVSEKKAIGDANATLKCMHGGDQQAAQFEGSTQFPLFFNAPVAAAATSTTNGSDDDTDSEQHRQV